MKLAGRSVVTRRSAILGFSEGYRQLAGSLKSIRSQGGKVFLLADTNTERYCLPALLEKVPSLQEAPVLRIEAGEESKSLRQGELLWEQLARHRADRRSLLINLGGGVVSDLGGFVAAGFKRGIDYVNIPTTLIGMADAAIGGKTGVNLGPLKNQVGAFLLPRLVVIDPVFLSTLPEGELRSGFAEVAKAALVGDARLWKRLNHAGIRGFLGTPFTGPDWIGMLSSAAAVKNRIVRHDFEERGERRLLNFGHTFGHALESLGLKQGRNITHGEAIAAGIVMASFLSRRIAGLSQHYLDDITRWVLDGFGKTDLAAGGLQGLREFLEHDKKSSGGRILFTLLAEPGRGLVNRECSPEAITEAVEYYNHLQPVP